MIYLLELDLEFHGGHEQTLVSAIKDRSVDERMEIICSRKLSEPKLESENVLHKILTPRDAIKQAEYGLTEIDADAERIFNVINTCGEPALMVVPSAKTEALRIVLALYANHDCTFATRLRVLVPSCVSKLSQEEIDQLRILCADGRISIGTEFQETALWLNDELSLPAAADFLLPCLFYPTNPSVQLERVSSKTVTVGFLGGLRREKGKYEFPKIYRELRKLAKRDRSGTRFVLQYQGLRRKRRSPEYILYEIYLAVMKVVTLSSLGKVRIRKLPGLLDDKSYSEALSGSDILLLPYRRENYAFRGSGVLTDGIVARKPIVYTEGIGGKEFLWFGNAEPGQTPQGYAQAIYKIAGSYNEYRAGADKAHDVIRERLDQVTFSTKR